ncbi:SDR family oxidoreductase [Mycolicibacterium boenickei]|nr:SDR family oxidoreductase [Mycolicibacterium boenickei]
MTTTTDAEIALLPEALTAAVSDALSNRGLQCLLPQPVCTPARIAPRVLIVGVMPPAQQAERFLDTDEARWWDVVERTLASAFEQLQCVNRMAENGGGRVVLIANDAGVCGDAGRSIESALGGAAIAMTKSLAREFSPSGVSVNAAAVQTDLLYGLHAEGYGIKVAQLVAFLADLELEHLTGQIVACNNSTIRARI